jgi:GntR family transcriptional regulator
MVIYMTQVPDFDATANEAAYLWARVANHIACRIKVGELAAGARLPGERDLADEYRVSLGTARRAIEDLRDRKLVVTLPAKGTFVMPESERRP